ncbi:MAG: hypothetical protein COY66_05025 [Candidatus Kerfeldbacteria bacterium CG_4_10_14_0_8_um_filter_42_10]|uniref:Uncharacterized protein n=1 Tax=Candidatus Kerfeldbacteria bacterium CG_4_10_14_0_8_um_filter_42_10 TaxID=2014248 RepID=A0A2M7RH59_9BACT|nr:MAG: hypothetical protein COY66_05025 [Candidatus Kerfeldbacteria bacterium CG_4_10_14_0_8_um_filter_42_10]
MRRIILDNINLGGLADSKYLGTEKSVQGMAGLDVHTEPGVIKVNQKLTKESGSTVDGFAKTAVVCSDGNTYFFTDNGKIIKRTAAGAYSVFRSVSGAILGAFEYDGFVYYARAHYLGRWLISDPTYIDDTDRSFQNDGAYHPMLTLNGVLYIGDGNVVAQMEKTEIAGSGTITSAGTYVYGVGTHFTTEAIARGKIRWIDNNGNSQERYITSVTSDTVLHIESAFDPTPPTMPYKLSRHIWSANALDLTKDQTITSLGPLVTELLIGTTASSDSNICHIYRWNTWSLSFSADDIVPENSINCFLPTDNYVLVQAGSKGNFYVYSNNRLEPMFKLPGVWLNKTAIIHPCAAVNFNNMPYFGLSNVSGNPAGQGIYSYGGHSSNYPRVLNLEYIISQDKTASIEIGAVVGVGSIILVAWKDGTTYGVDKLDFSYKYTSAYFESRLIITDRSAQSDAVIRCCYRSLPTNTNLSIKIKKDHAAAWSDALTTRIDATRKFIETINKIGVFITLEVRIEFTVSVNNAPELERVEIDLP